MKRLQLLTASLLFTVASVTQASQSGDQPEASQEQQPTRSLLSQPREERGPLNKLPLVIKFTEQLKLNDIQSKLFVVQDELSRTEFDLSTAKQESNFYRKSNDTYREFYEEQQRHIKELDAEIAGILHEAHEFQRKEYDKSITLERENETLKLKIQELNNLLDEKEVSDRRKYQRESGNENIEDLKEELQDLKKSLEKSKARIDYQENSLDGKNAQIDGFRGAIEDYQGQLSLKDQEIDFLRRKIQKVTNEKDHELQEMNEYIKQILEEKDQISRENEQFTEKMYAFSNKFYEEKSKEEKSKEESVSEQRIDLSEQRINLKVSEFVKGEHVSDFKEQEVTKTLQQSTILISKEKAANKKEDSEISTPISNTQNKSQILISTEKEKKENDYDDDYGCD